MKISYKSLYGFKEDFCRRCTMSLYEFNDIQSFIDILNGDVFNTDKFSWNSWYYMYSDEDDKVYLSSNIMMW